MTFDPPERFNMVSYFLEGNLEAGRSDKVALTAKDRYGDVRELTYGDVAALTNRTGRALRALGVEMEDRVLLAVGDGPEFVAGWFGALKIGGVVAAVNPLLPRDDYAYYLEYTRAKVALCDEDSLPGFLAALPDARHLRALIVVGNGGELPGAPPIAILRFDDATSAAPAELAVADTSRDDVAVWLFTSGTTGKPKGAVHFHHDFVFNCERYAKQVLELREDDRTMGVPKLFFGYATGSNLMFPFAAGASVVLFHEGSKPDAVVANVDRFRPTVLVNVPTTINGMLAIDGLTARFDLTSLRFMTSAGEALPPELYERWRARYRCEILDGIGSAEMFHVFISNRHGDVRLGSLGKLVPGYDARIVGPDERDVPEGEVGTLWIGGGSAALCYWNDRAKSRATMRGDWIVTADQFRRDAEGYYYYSGRADDMLKVGGIWVSPLEIESCLLQHEAVRECAVVGYADEDLVKPRAFVVLADGFDAAPALAEELKEYVKATLARYKYPRDVRFMDALPRSDRGKVLKNLLRELA